MHLRTTVLPLRLVSDAIIRSVSCGLRPFLPFSCATVRYLLCSSRYCKGSSDSTTAGLGWQSLCAKIDLLRMSNNLSAPPPRYGMPCTPGYSAPIASTYQSSVLQYPQHARTQSSYVHTHARGPSNGMEPTPHVNSYSVQANAQNGATSGEEVNRTFAESANQAYPHILPPQSYPFVPVPLDNTHFSQSSIQPPTNTTIPPSRIYHSSKSSSLFQPKRSQGPDSEHSKSIVPAVSDLEDGEVDDEEIDKLSNTSGEIDMGLKFSRFPQQNDTEKNDLAVDLHSNGLINPARDQPLRLDQDSKSHLSLMHLTQHPKAYHHGL